MKTVFSKNVKDENAIFTKKDVEKFKEGEISLLILTYFLVAFAFCFKAAARFLAGVPVLGFVTR